MVGQEYASAVSISFSRVSKTLSLTEFAEEFALMEASYAIIRIIQSFPELRLPPETASVPPGEEKQALTMCRRMQGFAGLRNGDAQLTHWRN